MGTRGFVFRGFERCFSGADGGGLEPVRASMSLSRCTRRRPQMPMMGPSSFSQGLASESRRRVHLPKKPCTKLGLNSQNQSLLVTRCSCNRSDRGWRANGSCWRPKTGERAPWSTACPARLPNVGDGTKRLAVQPPTRSRMETLCRSCPNLGGEAPQHHRPFKAAIEARFKTDLETLDIG